MRRRRTLLLVAPMLALAACQQADVGQSCAIEFQGGTQAVPTPSALWSGDPVTNNPPPCKEPPCGAEYVEFNNPSCENLVCVLSPVAANKKYSSGSYAASGYCSKPCVSDRDCYKSDTGLVCRNVVLDTTFLASLDPATKARYLGDVEFSNYCAVPLQ